MTNPYREMCAELVDAVEQAQQALEGWANYGQWVWPESALEQAKRNTTEALALLNRARALLDQTVAEGPTDEELISPIVWMLDDRVYDTDTGEIGESLRELIARWGNPTPQPPADGEVAELVKWLRAEAADDEVHDHTMWLTASDMRRAADLLERLESDNAGLTATAESLYFDNISLLDN